MVLSHAPHLFSLLALLLLPALAQASPKEAEVRVGWEGWVRPGFWHPVTVILRDPLPGEGRLVLEVLRGQGGRIRYSTPVRLWGPEPRILRLVIPIQDVRVRVGGWLQVGQTRVPVRVHPHRTARFLVGVVDRERRALGGVAGLAQEAAVVQIGEQDLPEEAVAYTSLDLLVIRTLEERALNHRQRRALQAWVLHGGRVVVDPSLPPTGPLTSWLLRASRVGLGRVSARLSADAWDPAPPRFPSGPEPAPGPPRPPFWMAFWGLLSAWLATAAFLRAGASRPVLWVGLPGVTVVVTVGLVLLAGEVRRAVTFPVRSSVTVVVDGVAWTYGRASQVSAYGGPVMEALPSGSHPVLLGSFPEAEIEEGPNGTWVRAEQPASWPLHLRWERVSFEGTSAELEPSGNAVILRGGSLGRSWFVWQGRGIEVPHLAEGRTDLRPDAERVLDPDHPALGWRALVPSGDAIIKQHPVVVSGDQGRWVVLVVNRP